jgi:DNA-binding MarR family transcriptional regulator
VSVVQVDFAPPECRPGKVCETLRVAGDLLDRELNHRVERMLGVTRSVLDALVVIERTTKPITPSQVAEQIAISGATMTAVIDVLEARGWARRVRNPRDRRSVFLVVTPEGRATTARVVPGLREIERRTLAVLTPDEQWQLTSLLERVLARAAELAGARA